MSLRVLWRSFVFIVALLFIFLAYPILIVPSSLPAINAIIVESTTPPQEPDLADVAFDPDSYLESVSIQELSPPKILNTSEKVDALLELHSQGIDLIFNR